MGIAALQIVDRKPAADVEHARRVARAARRCAAARGNTSMASTNMRGSGGLRSDMERQAVDLDAQLRREPQQARAPPAGSQPNLRDRSHTRIGAAEGRRESAASAVAVLARTCAARRDCRRRNGRPRSSSAVRISLSRLMGCVWMQRSGGDLQAAHQLHLAVGRQIETGALGLQRRR